MDQLLISAIGAFCIGILGSMLGVGGGIFLTPYLVFFTTLRPVEAVGVSLCVVIGTAFGGASKALASGQANLRLALALEPLMIAGSVAASLLAHKISDGTLLNLFGGMMLAVGLVFLWRARAALKAPVQPDSDGFFDGAIVEPDGDIVEYRPQKMKTLLGLVTMTGAASGLFGIGGGSLNVPYFTLLSKIPMRAATATSILTMAVTGAAGGAVHIAKGTVPAAIVAAALVGVFLGARLGLKVQTQLPERGLRALFGLFAFCVAVATFIRASGMS